MESRSRPGNCTSSNPMELDIQTHRSTHALSRSPTSCSLITPEELEAGRVYPNMHKIR